jgi:hypothetical protein
MAFGPGLVFEPDDIWTGHRNYAAVHLRQWRGCSFAQGLRYVKRAWLKVFRITAEKFSGPRPP